MTSREIAIDNIRRVARKLGPLREKAVFLGGAITALLISDPGAADVRPTKDVDAAVQTSSLSERTRLDEDLRALGFQHCMDPGAPTCRWIVDDCLVDVIPVGAGVNAYDDRWSPAAIAHSAYLELEAGLTIRHVTATYFVAIKLETFGDRGGGDYLYSQDIEDIIQIVDGRPELIDEFRVSEPELRTYVSEQFRTLMETDSFLESLSAHLQPDAASQARAPLIIERMSHLTHLDITEN